MPEADNAVVRGRVAVNVQPIPLFRVAHVADDDVVVLTPEERNSIEGPFPAEHVTRSSLALTFCNHPVLHPDVLAGARSGQRAMSPAA